MCTHLEKQNLQIKRKSMRSEKETGRNKCNKESTVLLSWGLFQTCTYFKCIGFSRRHVSYYFLAFRTADNTSIDPLHFMHSFQINICCILISMFRYHVYIWIFAKKHVLLRFDFCMKSKLYIRSISKSHFYIFLNVNLLCKHLNFLYTVDNKEDC